MLLKLFTILLLINPSNEPKTDTGYSDLIISNANIITLEDDSVLENTDFRIVNGIIEEIGQNLQVTEEANVIDGTGLYIMPALFDMHAHVGYMNPWHEYHLALYSYFGVHHVNLMSGSDGLIEIAGRYNNSKTELGPTISLASELIDGDPPMWGDDHNGPILTDPDQVKDVLLKLKEKEYRELKVYNRLSSDVYSAILEKADILNLRVVGHIPYELPMDDRLDPRQHRIEHLEGYLELAFDGDLTTLSGPYMERKQELMEGYSRDKMIEIARLTSERGIWNTPTHVLYASLNDNAYIEEMMDGKVSEWVDPGLQQFWRGIVENPEAMTHIRSEKFNQIHLDMIGILHNAGALLMAGTDAPLPVLLYGHSLHKELQYFVKAGMSPYEALKSATVNPAEYLDMKRHGKVLEGYHANLLVLQKNPLENIANTLTIKGMVLENDYVTRPDMERSLQNIREKLLELGEHN